MNKIICAQTNKEANQWIQGTIGTALDNIITALIKVVLVVPWAIVQLEWIGGPVAIIILRQYHYILLSCLWIVTGLIRNCCYMDVMQVYLGERKALWCVWVQYVVFYAAYIVFTLTSVISVRIKHNYHVLFMYCWKYYGNIVKRENIQLKFSFSRASNLVGEKDPR